MSEVVGGSFRKQVREVKRVFRKVKGDVINGKIFYEHLPFGNLQQVPYRLENIRQILTVRSYSKN